MLIVAGKPGDLLALTYVTLRCRNSIIGSTCMVVVIIGINFRFIAVFIVRDRGVRLYGAVRLS